MSRLFLSGLVFLYGNRVIATKHSYFRKVSKGTTRYRVKDENAMYFITFATVNWIDVFTRKECRDIVVDSIRFCQERKGLLLYSWCLMSNHIHLVVSAKEGNKLSSILRDMKKHSSKEIIKWIQNSDESRKEWLLNEMLKAGENNSKNQTYQLWRNDNHPIELDSNLIIDQKIDYIHNNPVAARIVDEPKDYIYSSARDYHGIKGLLQINVL